MGSFLLPHTVYNNCQEIVTFTEIINYYIIKCLPQHHQAISHNTNDVIVKQVQPQNTLTFHKFCHKLQIQRDQT